MILGDPAGPGAVDRFHDAWLFSAATSVLSGSVSALHRPKPKAAASTLPPVVAADAA